MGFNPNAVASKLDDKMRAMERGSDIPTDRTFMDFLQQVLDDGFQKGKPSLDNVDITSASGSLFIPMSKFELQALHIGNACASYWVSAITPGIPEACDSIVSVVNDAGKIAPVITSKINALAYSLKVREPYYEDMIKIIFDAVKTILWTVTEASYKCNSSFVVTIS